MAISTSSSPEIDHLSTRDAYDRWAAIYDGEGNPLVTMEQPHVDQLLGQVTSGMRIADIGCGTGRHALRLAAHGARVTALDFSEEMLNKARQKASQPDLGPAQPVTFVVHDLAHRLPLDDQSFDRVICGLVLDHIPNLAFLFSEMRRICRADGCIVVSIMHPALMLKGVQARFTDPITGRETRPQSCPHQISDYVMAAHNAGVAIDHLSEHAVDERLAAQCPRAQKYLGWPLLFMMRMTPRA